MTSPLDTRMAAYRAIQRVAPGIDTEVLGAIAAEPRTCDEVEVVLSLGHATASSAINRLLRAQRIVSSGETRRTRAGRQAVVWRLRGVLEQEERPRETAKERAARLARELVEVRSELKAAVLLIAELREELAARGES